MVCHARTTWVQWKDHESTYLCFMAKRLQNRDERKNAMAITEDACDQVMVNGIAVDKSQLWIVEFYWSEEGFSTFSYDLSLWFLRW